VALRPRLSPGVPLSKVWRYARGKDSRRQADQKESQLDF
jgi:hypothetical protein